MRGGPGVLADNSGGRGLSVGHVRSMTLPEQCRKRNWYKIMKAYPAL